MNETEITFTIIFTTLILLILVIGIALSISITNRNSIQQELIINQLKLSYQKELLLTQSEISETILTNLSRELHDNLGQQLVYFYLQLENLELDHPLLEDELTKLKQTVTGATGDLRSLSHSLNGDFVQTKGFLKAFLSEMARLQNLKKPSFTLNYDNSNYDNDVALDGNQQLIAFRIFQEMVSNALKHANANNIAISLTGGSRFLLQCRDDGKGFDYNNMQLSGSGLANMQKRAALAGMELNIESTPGSGSCFRLGMQAT